jgi:deazaflavin-dependent oxidoreductase (nitroreductase family)
MRALYRLPLLLRRLGIRGYERLVGIDWLALTTTGRRSGQPHTVMLDVVGRNAAGTVYVQPSRPRAAWVLNARANAAVTVDVDGRTYTATAVEVTGDEGADVVLRFIRSHPLYARLVVWLVGYTPTIDVPDEVLRERLHEVVVFSLRPRYHSGGPCPASAPAASSLSS